ncbi:MAG TPA: hypothetical protein VLR54_04480 [Methanobacteriaceae archaeon]|jgi:hypothetical protein|nr:hypothetical protein [Methanobacteriaceae archaeon]
MKENQLRMIKIILIMAVVFALLAATIYGIYAFSLFWQTFAAGITISFLFIILILLMLLAIYLWVRTLLVKRELNKCKNDLEMARIELKRCESKLNKQNE